MAKNNSRLSIGLMSGTSMDGIDAALIATDGESDITMLDGVSLDYEPQFKILLKAAECAVRQQAGDLSLAERYFPQAIQAYLTTELNSQVSNTIDHYSFADVIAQSTQLHIEAVQKLLQKTGYAATQINVVGYHGQTLFHQPYHKITIQIGDGQLLANQTKITVVDDFRSADVTAGGQGAPLAPLYHQALAIRDQKIPLAVVNCGGIANITIINGETPDTCVGFDTGPGNGLIDRYIKRKTAGREVMDKDGQYGLQGKVADDVLAKLHQQLATFLNLPPPKSLDIGDFDLITELDNLSLEDACATLEAFTADTIVKSFRHVAVIPKLWVLAGGGWHNPVICRELQKRLQSKLGDTVQIKTANEMGWSSQYMEAQIFAYLAVRVLQGKPTSFPSMTQVPHPLCGGRVFIPNEL